MELIINVNIFYIENMKKREAQKISDEVVTALKAIRLKAGISQYKLAKDTGLSKSTILRIERMEQKPTLVLLTVISNYLKTDLGIIYSKIYNNSANNE